MAGRMKPEVNTVGCSGGRKKTQQLCQECTGVLAKKYFEEKCSSMVSISEDCIKQCKGSWHHYQNTTSNKNQITIIKMPLIKERQLLVLCCQIGLCPPVSGGLSLPKMYMLW